VAKKLLSSILFVFVTSFEVFAAGNICQNYNLFSPLKLSNDENLLVEADNSTVKNKNIFVIDGNASVISSDYALRADNISLNKEQKISKSLGNVKFNDSRYQLLTDSLLIKKESNNNYIETTSATFSEPIKKLRGKAEKISGTSSLKTFDNATYTKCPSGNNNWSIAADSIVLNSDENQGIAKNATLKLYDIPILYTPYHEWVLEGKGSGFLAPSISRYSDVSTSKKGVNIDVPYFINIAPDRDLLLSLNSLSTRGENMKGKYSQLLYDNPLFSEGRLDTEIKLLVNDDVTNEDRWSIDNELSIKINENSDLLYTNKRVSDKEFFREIALEGSSVERLISALELKFRKNGFLGNLYSESEQTVNSGNDDYTRNADLSLSRQINLNNNLVFNFQSNTTNFDHKNDAKITGIRNHLNLKIAKNFKNESFEIIPSLTYKGTFYNLKNSNPHRSIVSGRVDSKIFLERSVNFFNTPYVQKLTPILTYSFSPKKDQSNIPNFDSSLLSNSYGGLFDNNRFSGLDKISNDNSLTFGIENEFINNKTGDTNLTLKAAQKFYFDKVLLNDLGVFEETTETARGYSDIETLLDFNYSNFNFFNTLSYDPVSNQFDRTLSFIRINIDPKKNIGLSHIDDNNNKSAQLFGVYKFTNNEHIFWNINRNLSLSHNDRITFGIASEDCCLAYRFAFFKTRSNESQNDYNRVFELVFKGFSSTSPSLKDKIESEVPNYIGDLDFKEL